ncbi:MAG: hypothetical protein SFY66_11960 [Oculatellaceae cyanobacterium bins.114]|nr:hypothetical protein [Oculatellaceae cyanobacterium bins.114]
MNPYELVACSFHDELESLATLRQRCKIIYRTATNDVVEVDSRIVDVYAANKADFLKLEDGTEIRLDYLVEVNGKPIQFTCG